MGAELGVQLVRQACNWVSKLHFSMLALIREIIELSVSSDAAPSLETLEI